MRYFLLIFVLSLANVQVGSSQTTALDNKINDQTFIGGSVTKLLDAAAKAQKAGDDFSAFKYYELAVKKDSSSKNLLLYADAAAQVFGYEQAAHAYQIVIDRNDGSAIDAQLQLAAVYYRLGRYEEAGALYEKIAAVTVGQQQKDAKAASADCLWAADHKNDTDQSIKIDHLPESINSVYSEFAPLLMGDTLYFSSYRFPFEADKQVPQRMLSKVLSNKISDETAFTNVSGFSAEGVFTAHTAINKDKTKILYTVCKHNNAGGEVDCQIYQRTRDSLGAWVNPEPLPDMINLAGFNTTQPNIGYDLVGGQEILFFSSNRPGGKGQRDLWYSLILTDHSFAQPVNLTDLNTSGDEVSPFYHNNTGVLYYSTDGLKTVGGYDIFKSRGAGTKWSEPEHLQSPLNGSANDLFFILSDDGYDGYFASNRPGALYFDTVGCCYDLFHADLFKPQLAVRVLHKETGDCLTGTKITILPLNKTDAQKALEQQDALNMKIFVQGLDMQNANTVFVEGIEQIVDVDMDGAYLVIAEKEGFEPDTIIFITPGTPWRPILRKDLVLTPARLKLFAYSFETETESSLNGTTFVFRDLGLVTSDGTLATPKDVNQASETKENDERSNLFERALDFNHRYVVTARKNGYSIDSVLISTEGMSSSGSLIKKLFLSKGGVFLDAFAFHAATRKPLQGVTFLFKEVTSTTLLDQKPVDGHQYSRSLAFGKSYMVIAQKEHFVADTVYFNTTNLTELDKKRITENLYLTPSSASGYLPLSLYFDNDEPAKAQLPKRTRQSYGATYQAYEARRADYDKKSPDGTVAIHEFFDANVKSGWENFNKFTAAILQELQNGRIVELEISGYASPLSDPEYNRNLTSRRIHSIQNHFNGFRAGDFRKYIETNQLRFKEVPQGEDMAPQGISDSVEDKKQSVYSIAASKERRVQISRVNITTE